MSQLDDQIASVVQDTPALDGVRCMEEVSDLHQNSTALYFTLTDGDAELPCMIWANRYRNMDADLEESNWRPYSTSIASIDDFSTVKPSVPNRVC